MSEMCWPFDNSPSVTGSNVSESGWTKMSSLWSATGIVKDTLNELQPYGDSSGRQIKVKSGRAWIQGVYYESDAETTVTIAANSSGSLRIDRVVTRVNWTSNTCVQTVIQGTPGAGVPAPTWSSTTWDLLLCQVSVANGASVINAADVTDERGATSVYTAAGAFAAGFIEPRVSGILCLSTKRPTTYPVGGQIMETDTGHVYINTGTAATPAWGHAGDTDANTSSPHHTIGIGASQSAAGNHRHDADYSTLAHTHGVSGAVVGTQGAQTLASKTFVDMRFDMTVGGVHVRASGPVDLGQASTQAGRFRSVKAWGGDVPVTGTGSAGFLAAGTAPASVTIKNGDSQMFVASVDNYWELV
jgi:hypothetical protein